ncbi:hypothetical protein MRB53_018810 [Persea americana]|uniref:Uncharacterized protein n=1 Tax=Persea americana TaxID=3435 RepID=A0ACC2M8H3_PERAE|nr:hypothetical protein MRB53_018810 [Persea americana]|eukprot:TRINITY_DN3982_c0_g1_i8.p1 TRINITY_DN3982_c0_g1~~TRINITY_DN3982_c0_g1_i8.p1  ORF type:complete len:228 (-),score=47.96 TRINITY_DN3982_c0_g1_i8:1662-2267(-)
MAVEDCGKPCVGGMQKEEVVVVPCPTKVPLWPLLVLRGLALCATVSATLVMAFNKQTKTMVVALIGNTTITGSVTAKFQQTPAFVFFVTANAIATLHNMSLLLLRYFGDRFYLKGFGLLITISDMVMVALVSSGAAAAASIAELGKNGNSHARWNRICGRFNTFCDHTGGALIASFIAVGLLMALNALSTINLYKKQEPQY